MNSSQCCLISSSFFPSVSLPSFLPSFQRDTLRRTACASTVTRELCALMATSLSLKTLSTHLPNRPPSAHLRSTVRGAVLFATGVYHTAVPKTQKDRQTTSEKTVARTHILSRRHNSFLPVFGVAKRRTARRCDVARVADARVVAAASQTREHNDPTAGVCNPSSFLGVSSRYVRISHSAGSPPTSQVLGHVLAGR